MTDPNNRVLWWEERIKQENKALVKLLKARRKEEAREAVGGDKERAARRKELASKVKTMEAALAEERVTRYRLESELKELEAVAKKADEHLTDPIVLNKQKNSGGAVAAALSR
jgi:hypothetical protein